MDKDITTLIRARLQALAWVGLRRRANNEPLMQSYALGDSTNGLSAKAEAVEHHR